MGCDAMSVLFLLVCSLLLPANSFLLGALTSQRACTRTRHLLHASLASSPSPLEELPLLPASNVTVVVAGATGYIGRKVVRECAKRGYDTVALCRSGKGGSLTAEFRASSNNNQQEKEALRGNVKVVETDVMDVNSLRGILEAEQATAIITCLASRSGTKADAFAIDYQATKNCLTAAVDANVRNFVMLSAFCVQKPLLQLQKAKLKFEGELRQAGKEGKITFSIVRPTAFFKSVSNKVNLVQNNMPFIVYGDGSRCRCNPISEEELSEYLVNCVTDTALHNRVMPLGGPDDGISSEQQGILLAEAFGKKPWIVKLPLEIFDVIIAMFEFGAKFIPAWEDGAEIARIVRYYAVEDMLTTDSAEKFGTMTLQQHYERTARRLQNQQQGQAQGQHGGRGGAGGADGGDDLDSLFSFD